MPAVVLGGEELVGFGGEKSLPVLDAGAPGHEDSRLPVNSSEEPVLDPIARRAVGRTLNGGWQREGDSPYVVFGGHYADQSLRVRREAGEQQADSRLPPRVEEVAFSSSGT